MEGRSYIFLKSFEGWRGIRNFVGKCIFGLWGERGEKGERGRDREIFGLRRRRDNIYYL